jgi:hypothetical protein
MFCQNLAMLHGKPDTRPNTVMGFAPILAMLTSQLASKKIVDDADKSVESRNDSSSSRSPGTSRPVDANDQGPAILQSLLKMLPGLTSMVGVYYDQENDGSADMGLSCGPDSHIRNTPACHRYHGMRGEVLTDMGGCGCATGGCGTSVGGGCGCGIPCDGIQPNAPYMSEYHVTQRNAPFVPRRVQRTNYDWNRVERVNTQAQNNFGRVSHMDSSASPVHTDIGGYYDEHEHEHEEQVPCAKGGTCGKSCCGSH